MNKPQPETLPPAPSNSANQSKAVQSNLDQNIQIQEHVMSERQSQTLEQVKEVIGSHWIEPPVLFSSPKGPIQNVIDSPPIPCPVLFCTQKPCTQEVISLPHSSPPIQATKSAKVHILLIINICVWTFLILNTDSKVVSEATEIQSRLHGKYHCANTAVPIVLTEGPQPHLYHPTYSTIEQVDGPPIAIVRMHIFEVLYGYSY